ncbi:MAG TPA: outer membrane protein transport protein [Burkholderiales bacterium]
MLAPSAAFATAGYFQLGYGLKSMGMAGASAALPQDALAAATNPAGMVWVGDRLDAGLEWFTADRNSRISGNGMGLNGERHANGSDSFLIPEFGANRMLDAQRSVGVSVFGNGGSAQYRDNPLAALGGSDPAGMEFIQGTIAPTYAMKLGERNSVGLSLHLVYQEFEARGFEHFDDPAFSSAPGSVTNRGRDHALGVGWRAGWLGRLTPGISLAAAYQPATRMQKFERYKGLLADGGSFDVPAHWVVGTALKLGSATTFATDVQRIYYSRVRGLGNRSDCFLSVTCPLGAKDGPGPGWRDTTVFKFGLAHEASSRFTLRAGVAVLHQPVPADQTLLNVFAPAVTQKHLTLGATWQLPSRMELTFAYQHAFEQTVRGTSTSVPGGVGGGQADVRMKQDAFGLALGWPF